MNHSSRHQLRLRRVATLVLALVALGSLYALPKAQSAKKALTIEDYSKWRNISGQAISGDGKWVTCVLRLTNVEQAEAKPVLHIINADSGEDTTVADATGGTFSPDSKWIAYQVDPGASQRARAARGGSGATGQSQGGQAPSAGQGGRGGAASRIPPRRVELRNLATGDVRSWQEIESFTFNNASTYLFMRRRAAEAAAGGRGAGAAPATPPQGGGRGRGGAASRPPGGRDVILINLETGRYQLLGSVGDMAFNREGNLLAYTIEGQEKDANGLFVFDTRSGRTVALDNDARIYNRMIWNDGGDSIAVLKGVDVEKMRERDNLLAVFTDVPSAVTARTTGGDQTAPSHVVLEPAKAEGFPKGWVISDRAALSFSDDGKRVFFGMKEQVPEPPSDTGRGNNANQTANVDVWNTADERVQSLQMSRAQQDRNFTYDESFDLAARKFVKLADETMKDLDVAQDGRWAVGRDARGYSADLKPAAADFYRVNTTTGERTLIVKNQLLGQRELGISPDGHEFLYWKDNRFQAYDLDAGTGRTLGGATKVSFVNTEDDHPGPKPSYGVAGYSDDGKGVIVQNRYDLWLLPFDGSEPKCLTNGEGAKKEIRFRYVRTEPDDPSVPRSERRRQTIDLTRPITLSAYGEWTKKAGFYELSNGQLTELIYEDAMFSNPTRAMKADKYLFTRQTFVEFPDLRVSGPGFKDSKKITDANPEQADYTWGHRILFDFKNKDGMRLQGILAIPDDYKQGEKRPMIVTFYEKNSQTLHAYSAPAYMVSMGRIPMEAVSRGYLVMLPDVYYHTGRSHSDQLECVEAATKKVIEMGYADPKHIGVTGHSYGGEGADFIGVMSKMFAAVGTGAGVSDLYNDFNQNWGWSYHYSGGGEDAFQYYLSDQGRWGFSPWDKPDVYHYESALDHVPQATTPILIMHGTSDPTVNFYNSIAFYNALRYNGKTAFLLAYQNEGHHLGRVANQKDLTVRFFEFFDHYLKGTPAPKWMTEGVPFLKKEETAAESRK